MSSCLDLWGSGLSGDILSIIRESIVGCCRSWSPFASSLQSYNQWVDRIGSNPNERGATGSVTPSTPTDPRFEPWGVAPPCRLGPLQILSRHQPPDWARRHPWVWAVSQSPRAPPACLASRVTSMDPVYTTKYHILLCFSADGKPRCRY
jgi:hypothetical protein